MSIYIVLILVTLYWFFWIGRNQSISKIEKLESQLKNYKARIDFLENKEEETGEDVEFKNNKDIYKLDIGETTYHASRWYIKRAGYRERTYTKIIRVPNGWLFEGVFVPEDKS